MGDVFEKLVFLLTVSLLSDSDQAYIGLESFVEHMPFAYVQASLLAAISPFMTIPIMLLPFQFVYSFMDPKFLTLFRYTKSFSQHRGGLKNPCTPLSMSFTPPYSFAEATKDLIKTLIDELTTPLQKCNVYARNRPTKSIGPYGAMVARQIPEYLGST